MKKIIISTLLTILFAACKQKTKFSYSVTVSAPKEYLVEVHDGWQLDKKQRNYWRNAKSRYKKISTADFRKRELLQCPPKIYPSLKKTLYNYALENDGAHAIEKSLPKVQLDWLRNNYLHRSNKDDEYFTMSGSYV